MSTLDEDDVDAIARRVVELLLPALSDQLPSTPPPARPPALTATATATATALIDWLHRDHPDTAADIPGDTRQWAHTLADAAGVTDPVDALEWAWSAACPTSYWRTSHRPIDAPAPRSSGRNTNRADRGYRYGPWQQLLAEYRLSRSSNAGVLADVDDLVQALVSEVSAAGNRHAKATVTSRKNALAILTSTQDTPATVMQVVRWCLASKPHWKANLKGVPSPDTYRSMRGDWTGAGHGFDLHSIADPELREQVSDLAKGWAWYLSRALDRPVSPTSRSLRRIYDLLAGADGEPAGGCADLQAAVSWMCDATAGRARYYTDGQDFPRPDRARKAVLDMRTAPTGGGGVAGTNAAAGDLAGDHADDELKGML